MEDLINSIPKERNIVIDKKNGIRHGNAFCLRYSSARQKWLCGYNQAFKKGSENDEYSPWVEADDPVEAVAFFVEKISKQKR